jgi:16S rRNA (guanine527-N7)-methyltransferase
MLSTEQKKPETRKMNEILDKYLSSAGISGAAGKLEKHMDLVLEYNENVNLTAIRDRDDFAVKNIIDSLCIFADERYRRAEKIIDVGTGAGFPGIPLAIVSPDKEFVLMDSLGKRVKIIGEMAEKLGLENVKAVHSRAEDLAHDSEYRGKFDMCLSRAVSQLDVLAEYCLPFVKQGGYFVSYKGSGFAEEAHDAANALKILGGTIESAETDLMKEYGLAHVLLFIKKTGRTPAKYPRKAGTPKRNPL